MSGLYNNDINLSQRIIAASLGSLLTSIITTPQDVIKNRQQYQQSIKHKDIIKCCSYNAYFESRIQNNRLFHFYNGVCDVWCNTTIEGIPICSDTITKKATTAPRGVLSTFLNIIRSEGILTQYRGLRPALLISIPSNVIYFSSFDILRSNISNLMNIYVDKKGIKDNTYNTIYTNIIPPIGSGILSRQQSTTIVSPLELIRTKAQTIPGSIPLPMIKVQEEEIKNGGISNQFRGLSATLQRDIPFSAIYWVCMERLRHTYIQNLSSRTQTSYDIMFGSLISGMFSGTIATIITHPFDIIKTYKQVNLYNVRDVKSSTSPIICKPQIFQNTYTKNLSTWDLLNEIVNKDGFRGLYTGQLPRLSRVAPSCGIMIALYGMYFIHIYIYTYIYIQ